MYTIHASRRSIWPLWTCAFGHLFGAECWTFGSDQGLVFTVKRTYMCSAYIPFVYDKTEPPVSNFWGQLAGCDRIGIIKRSSNKKNSNYSAAMKKFGIFAFFEALLNCVCVSPGYQSNINPFIISPFVYILRPQQNIVLFDGGQVVEMKMFMRSVNSSIA